MLESVLFSMAITSDTSPFRLQCKRRCAIQFTTSDEIAAIIVGDFSAKEYKFDVLVSIKV